MIHLAWPWMLLALPLPWLAARALPAAAPRGSALFLPFASALSDTSTVLRQRRSRLRALLLFLTWILLVGAAARPQWLGEPEPVPTTGRRLLLAVDVSGSMEERDMAGSASRLQVVQKVAGDFILRRRGDQVGLVLFGTRPYLQAPLTADVRTVDQFLQEAVIGVAGTETAIGDAIGLALKRIKASADSSKTAGETVLILLTDGRSNAGVMPPLQAAQMAAHEGLKVYTIGVGADPSQGLFGGLFGGSHSDLDEETLKSIATTTGGAYFRATDLKALEEVYARIDALEPSKGADRWYRPSTEWYFWPLGAALLLSLPGVLLAGGRWT
jgi:Ca-activated chloride channel family protein